MTSTHPEDITKDYLRVFRNMYQYVDFFVINIACNTSTKPFEPRTEEEIRAILDPLFEFRRGQPDYCPILLKVSPDLTKDELDMVIDILIETPSTASRPWLAPRRWPRRWVSQMEPSVVPCSPSAP